MERAVELEAGDDAPNAPRAFALEVPRTARYYTVGDRGTARSVWLAVHGYGQLAGYFARHFAPHAEGRLVVAPEALSRFYVGRAEGGDVYTSPTSRRQQGGRRCPA